MGLSELLEAGIRPADYVWCKGMADWQPAEEVPDICRAMRRALAGLDPETGEEPRRESAVPSYGPGAPPKNRIELAEMISQAFIDAEENARPDYSYEPQGVSIAMAVVLTLLCFPPTGFVAIYYACKCKSEWNRSLQPGIAAGERDDHRRSAHDAARLYRMLSGITVCIGIIMAGMVISRTLF